MEKNEALLRVIDLKTFFPIGSSWLGKQKFVKAVNGVDLQINNNEVLGLVGESGSGKTTLGRSILKLVPSTSGKIFVDGIDVTHLKGSELKKFRRTVQLIFQDPYASFNPRMQIGQIIAEPLILHKLVPEELIDQKVTELLNEVGLEDYFKYRYPHEMSGGQRQRIAIARVLGLQPKLIIADEAVSALDVSVTAQILNLLISLQEKNKMSLLIISHDLKVVGYMADRILVMYAGRIIEEAPANELLTNPLHPYTKLLIASIPGIENRNAAIRINDQINDEDLSTDVEGCPFTDRCPERKAICKEKVPVLTELESKRRVACFLY